MIDIELSEERIVDLLTPLSTDPVLGFKVVAFPDEDFIETNGRPMPISQVQVIFDDIQFDDVVGNKFGNCRITQVNEVNWKITVYNQNLREHRKVYRQAQAIVRAVRGRQILIQETGDEVQGASPAHLTRLEFVGAKNGGACYKMEIGMTSSYTDIYSAEVLV